MSKQLTDAKRKAIQKYDAENTKQIHLKLNLKTDADILEWLDSQKSIQGYIKALIRKDIRKEGHDDDNQGTGTELDGE